MINSNSNNKKYQLDALPVESAHLEVVAYLEADPDKYNISEYRREKKHF